MSKLSNRMIRQLRCYWQFTAGDGDAYTGWCYGRTHGRTELALLRRGLIEPHTPSHERDRQSYQPTLAGLAILEAIGLLSEEGYQAFIAKDGSL